MRAFAKKQQLLLRAALNLNLMHISTIFSGVNLFLYLTTGSTELCLMCRFEFFQSGVTSGDGAPGAHYPILYPITDIRSIMHSLIGWFHINKYL